MMALSDEQKMSVETIIRDSLKAKMSAYNPEPAVMPFHTRLLGKDRLALYSFIHSLNTNFGTTIFEPVAAALASSKFAVTCKVKAGGKISADAQIEIQNIMDSLSAAKAQPDKRKEIEMIRKVCRRGEIKTVKATRIDVCLKRDEEIYCIDIKTAKPNKGGFKEFKRTLLEWAAIVLYENPRAEVHTLIAIPYNPYEPKPYDRWTMAGMLDLQNELKVAEEFWGFLGGAGVYDDLLGCFERVGIEMRDQIDDYFNRFTGG